MGILPLFTTLQTTGERGDTVIVTLAGSREVDQTSRLTSWRVWFSEPRAGLGEACRCSTRPRCSGTPSRFLPERRGPSRVGTRQLRGILSGWLREGTSLRRAPGPRPARSHSGIPKSRRLMGPGSRRSSRPESQVPSCGKELGDFEFVCHG